MQTLRWELRQRLQLRVEYLRVQTWLVVDLWTRIGAEKIVSVCREGLAVAQEVLPLAVAERHRGGDGDNDQALVSVWG